MIAEYRVGDQLQFWIREASQLSEARRKVTAMAGQVGLGEGKAGACAIIVSEMGTNLLKHAKDGEILMRSVAHGSRQGLEILAMDRGPGMVSVGRSLEDGHSTSGSPGTGLGAIVRMATEFDIHSLPGRGTSLVARIWNSALHRGGEVSTPITGVINVAKPGESVSGDAWLSESSGRRTICAVVDGLGHGPLAAEASVLAIESLREHRDGSLADQVESAHGALRSTRGAALGVSEILHDQGIIKFVGIGNIMAAVQQNGTTRNMVSQNGILGHQFRRVTEFHYPWSESAMLIMCSDGINTHWDVGPYPGLTARDPSLIAAALYRDFARGRDDTTVMVLKLRPPENSPNL